jgi:hypothetical protein
MRNNYSIVSTSTITGLISKRYVYATGIDKVYDSQVVANITISNIVGNDKVVYWAQFNNKYADSNKLIYDSGLKSTFSGE